MKSVLQTFVRNVGNLFDNIFIFFTLLLAHNKWQQREFFFPLGGNGLRVGASCP